MQKSESVLGWAFGGITLNNTQRITLSSPDEVSRRLDELGLSVEPIREARKRGLSASLECTPSHAPTAAGTYAYHETVRWLRDLLKPLGWVSSDVQNRGLTVNSTETRALIVASGDEDTGIVTGNPSTRNPKGSTTVQAVRDNTIGWLFSEMEEDRERQARISKMETWIMLIFRDDDKGQFRSELSLPISTNDRLCPDLFRERIILDVIDFNNASILNAIPMNPVSPAGQSPEVIVEIKRRA